MMTTIEDNSYWNNISFDGLLDIDQLLASTFDKNYCNYFDQNCVLMKEECKTQASSSLLHQPVQQTIVPYLVCGVCGAPASGYNFDQVTCESCKAFFRRNALRNSPNLKCRFTGSCVIDARTRRQCTYCRLKKCFAINMRKDWIRTDKERERRQLQKLVKEQKKLNKLTAAQEPFLNLPIVQRNKKRLMIGPTIPNLIVKPISTEIFFGFNRDLSDEDRIILNNITSAYQTIDDQAEVLRQRSWMPPTSLIQFLNGETDKHQLLIRFYNSIPEFNQLDLTDRVALIKFNLVKIVHLHCILIYKFQENPFIGSCMSQWIDADFHQRMSRARKYFDRFMEHPLILKLILIIFIFNMNLLEPFDANPFKDYSNKANIRIIQEFYTTLLWRYLNHLYGEREAIRSMEIITTQILHYQALMNIMEDVLRRQVDVHKFNELESSLFHLSF